MAQEFITRQEPQYIRHDIQPGTILPDETAQAQAERMNAREFSFSQIASLLFQELPSESSRRVYRITFRQWEQFAAHNSFDVMDLFYDRIKSFLYSRSLSFSTRLSRKSHMQRLLRLAAYHDPSFGIHYIQLRDLKIKGTSKDNAPRRQPRRLSRSECKQLLSVWENDDSHLGIRNCAVLLLLLHTAVRNAELVALRWEDLDWEAQALTLNRDSAGQGCSVPILDPSPDTLNSLRRLQLTQRSVLADDATSFSFIFPALSTGMYARFTPAKDIPSSTQTIRNIVKQTAAIAGLGSLTSLDLRNTSLRMFSQTDSSKARISLSPDN